MTRFFCEIESGAELRGPIYYRPDTASGPFPFSAGTLIALFGTHAVLAIAMRNWTVLATVHALLTLLISLWCALVTHRVAYAAYAAAYVCGAEVLWRMTQADIIWEFGKYAIALILIVALLRSWLWRPHDTSLLYFLFMLPSVIMTVVSVGFSQAHKEISFNLSGPFTLMLSVAFFLNLKLAGSEMRRLFVWLMAPVFGIAALAIYSTLTAASIQFTGESNKITSGGYGPNQVSAMLGLGVVLAFFSMMYSHTRPAVRLVLASITIVFAGQSAMTFSRGGLYTALGSMAAACLFLVRDRRLRPRVFRLAACVLAGGCLILPWENRLTGGALSNRFEDTSLTHRGDLMQADVAVWKEHFVFGAGPGMAKLAHVNRVAAHTEFSRLFAEHGLFGVASIALLLFMAVQQVRAAPTSITRALAMALIAWSFLFMAANAMRIAAPSFVFGLAFMQLVPLKEGTYRLRNVISVPRPAV
jgi:hypothetical protein